MKRYHAVWVKMSEDLRGQMTSVRCRPWARALLLGMCRLTTLAAAVGAAETVRTETSEGQHSTAQTGAFSYTDSGSLQASKTVSTFMASIHLIYRDKHPRTAIHHI